jgi:spore germination protein YaaH
MDDIQMSRNLAGRLVLTLPNGQVHEGVTPVRAFPVQSPQEFVALVSTDGKELFWIDSLAQAPEDVRNLINEEIASREVMPVIHKLIKVSTYSTPSIWDVETDRGPTKLILKGEEDIRRLGAATLMITDSHGLRFYVADMQQLDKHSRRLLDRFL